MGSISAEKKTGKELHSRSCDPRRREGLDRALGFAPRPAP